MCRHALQPPLLDSLILRLHPCDLQTLQSRTLRLNLLDLFLTVTGENLAGFLEALVWKLLKGYLRARLEGGTPSATANRRLGVGAQQFAFELGSVDELRIEQT